jgi:class 3 adenylate cyclase
MASALTFPKTETLERVVIVAYAFISSNFMIFYMRDHPAMMPLDNWQNDIVFYIIASTTFLALVGVSYHFASVTENAEQRVQEELERSDQLLLNVLPEPIAQRLKTKPETIADSFEAATVLFADIVGFTRLASERPGPVIVDMLNEVFSVFDRIAEHYGLEKIKTIGDAYLVAGGVPVPRADHAVAVTAMALEMVDVLRQNPSERLAGLDIRIGIHSGPVVAGVIGEKKFAYDLWGDTVNVASRMESHGLPGRIQVSEATQRLIASDFDLEERGTLDVKGKGAIKTWLVRGRKETVSRQVA